MNPSVWRHLICPDHGTALQRQAEALLCAQGHQFAIVEEIPVLLPSSVVPTQEQIARRAQSLHVKKHTGFVGLHPHVVADIAATGGRLYRDLGPRLTRYPIPGIRLPRAAAERRFLDLGCNWGRWVIAAAQRGYTAVGIDPNLDALLAARHVAAEVGADASFVCGDARRLPFAGSVFDVCYSYSVLQHFSKDDTMEALDEVRRVLRTNGESLIQMPNGYGLFGFVARARRAFREGRNFDVRYWSLPELRRVFSDHIGPSTITTDTFLGLGAQPADLDVLPPVRRAFVLTSELLRRLSEVVTPARYFADSLFVRSVKTA